MSTRSAPVATRTIDTSGAAPDTRRSAEAALDAGARASAGPPSGRPIGVRTPVRFVRDLVDLTLMPDFKLVAPFEPTGDQPAAIESLVDGLDKGFNHQVLLGRHRHAARRTPWPR